MTPPTEAELLVPGVSRALARHRRRTLSEPAYAFTLRIPETRTEPIEGEVVFTVRWDDPLGFPLVLDFAPNGRAEAGAVRRALREVEVNGVVLDPDEVARNGHLRFDPGHLEAGAMNRIRLGVVAGDSPLNRREDLLYALFVPARAHHALPLADQPDLKAVMQWTLEIPGHWEGVANGGRARITDVGGARRRIEGYPTGPLPPYLMTFAAGVMEREERMVVDPGGMERTLVLFHRETDRERRERNLDAIFSLHAAALHGMEDWTGIPFPYAHPLPAEEGVELPFTFAAIPAFQYGGMEHPGAVWYRAETLFLDENATQAQLLGRASLIAHETAHMWFGNLVTMAWFDDVWTKEVFANFLAAHLVNPAFPEVDHELRFLLAHHPAAYGVDRTAGRHPVRQPLENLDHAGALYGPIIYQKAPVAMRQLERRLGPEGFRRGVRRYLETHAHGNATWGDLIRALDPETEEALEGWSRDWIDRPGRPEIRVERGDTDTFRLRAVPGPDAEVQWPQFLDPAWVGEGGLHPLEAVEVGVGERAEVRIPGGAREAGSEGFLLPDASGYGYALFRLPEEALPLLVRALGASGGPPVGAPRASALLLAYDAVLEGDLPPGDLAEALLARIPHETDEQLLSHTLGMVGTLLGRFLGGEEEARLRALAESALREELARGAPPRRSAALFGALREVARSPETLTWLEALHRGEESIPGFSLGEADRTALAFALALQRVDADAILDREEARITDPDRLARFRWLRPAVSHDPTVREAFFERLTQVENRDREPWVVAGLALLHHPVRHGEAGGEARHLRWLERAIRLLPEIRDTGDIFFPTQWLGAAMTGHATPEAVAVIDRTLEDLPALDPRLREKVLQAADPVRRAAALRGEGG